MKSSGPRLLFLDPELSVLTLQTNPYGETAFEVIKVRAMSNCPYGIIMTKAGSRIESGFLKVGHLHFRSFPDENEARAYNGKGGV